MSERAISDEVVAAGPARGAGSRWLLANRNFALLWAAYGVSALGDHLSEMGLLATQHALDPGRTDLTRRQAVMMFVFMFPFFLLGPLCGWVADRVPRKRIMIAADIIRCVMMIELLPVLYFLQRWFTPSYQTGEAVSLSVAVMPLAFVGIFAAFFSPARSSLLPTLVGPGQLVRANALTSGLGMIATIASAVLGGYLVEHYGARWNFRIDGLTFLASALLLAFIVPPREARAAAAKEHGIGALADGFRYVRRHGRVAEVILVSGVMWTAASVVRSLIPAIVKEVFHGGYADIGLYQGLLGLGLLVGAILLTLLGETLKSELAMAWSLKLAGLSGALMTLAVWLGWGRFACGAGLVLIGVFGAGIQVSVMALLQRMTPNYMRGRVFGVCDLVSMAGLLAATGTLAIPDWPNIDRHISWIMALTSAFLLVAGIWTTAVRLRRGRFGWAITFWKNLNEFYCRLWPRARRAGLCTIPSEGPVIVAANHASSLDPFLLTAMSPNRFVSFMIAREYAEIPGFRRLVKLIECVPVNRTGMDVGSIKAALRHLAEGRVLGIFPQGGIQGPDEAVEIREGVGMLALRSGATVIPAYVSGTRFYSGVIKAFLSRHRAVVRYGRPVDLTALAGREKDREAYREASEKIAAAIFALRPADVTGKAYSVPTAAS